MRLLNKFLYGLWYSCDRYFRLIGLLYVNLRKKIPARKSGGRDGPPCPLPLPPMLCACIYMYNATLISNIT